MIREFQSDYNADLSLKDEDASAAERLRRRIRKESGTTSTFEQNFWKRVKQRSACRDMDTDL